MATLLILALAVLFLACRSLPRPFPDATDSIVHELSLPGFRFRRPAPFTQRTAEQPLAKGHLELRRLPRQHRTVPPYHRSASSLFAQVQRDNGGHGYENITAVNHYGSDYAVEVLFNGVLMTMAFDIGSADTWIRGPNFRCMPNLNVTGINGSCQLGPAFPAQFAGNEIPNQHFALKYGNNQNVEGRLRYMDVGFCDMTVPKQEVALASQGSWRGNGVASGVLGFAYPALSNAYWGDNLQDDSQYNSIPWSPLLFSMINKGMIVPH
ncbi:hypothetical protein F4778DRAFT_784279 [Xylariomycetidae sp. FL2044]|nr:hypothetical protein F4778DRAFT_784279 [Xylariomycetidae sp. FL2044]